MKKFTTVLFLFIGVISFGQSTMTIFNNGGQQFYVILNGIKQNSLPQTNVSVSGINNGSYSVKLIFADGKTGDIDKNFFLEQPSFVTTRVVFKKGKGKLQLIGMEDANGQNATGTNIIYRPNNSSVYSDAAVSQTVTTTTQQATIPGNNQQNENVSINSSGSVQNQQSGTTTITTQQTQTTPDPTLQNGNVGINMNVNVTDPTLNNGQGGVNMSINMSGTGVGTNTSVNETQTTSQTTTTTTTTNGNQTITSGGIQTSTTNTNGQNTNMNSTSNTTQVVSSNASQNFVSCQKILGDVNVFIKDLEEFSFEEDKMDLTKKEMVGHCMTASQAYKLVEIYTFEANRLEIAKYLYPRMIDKENAKSIIPLFTFDATKLEYREFIRN